MIFSFYNFDYFISLFSKSLRQGKYASIFKFISNLNTCTVFMDQVIVISILLRDLEVIDLENCSVLDWVFWLKVFKTLNFLDPWLDSFDTCTAPRYWSKVLPTIIPFPLVTLISKSCTLKIHFFCGFGCFG